MNVYDPLIQNINRHVSMTTWEKKDNGCNCICIFKDLPIVVVITATRYNTMEADTNTQKILLNHIVPALHTIINKPSSTY